MTTNLSVEFEDRIYAGVLGKLIGVYLGRPFEGWTYHKIKNTLGYIDRYVHNDVGVPLVVSDDDISGTLLFLRALSDNNYKELSSEAVGDVWLNYLIENKTTLWWGGMGRSTEHTVYNRLRSGIKAPLSGAIETNGIAVAEQIGSQIFIDGWAMIHPSDPQKAYDYAVKAARVSHDGIAVDCAAYLAAIESQAFVEKDIDTLLDLGLTLLPKESNLPKIVDFVRNIHSKYSDWEQARDILEQEHGYHRYPGTCHMVPNHALILLSLLYGGDDFDKSMLIVNTAGWDTDCNAGNLGCLNGIRLGLDAIDDKWRKPLADKIYLINSDGGSVVTDAVKESQYIINIANKLQDDNYDLEQNKPTFNFKFKGSTQGFTLENDKSRELVSTSKVEITNLNLDDNYDINGLQVKFSSLKKGQKLKISTPTFIPEDGIISHYYFNASPSLYSGQTLKTIAFCRDAETDNLGITPYVVCYDSKNAPYVIYGEKEVLQSREKEFEWLVPDTLGRSIYKLGYEITLSDNDSCKDSFIVIKSIEWGAEPKEFIFKKFPNYSNAYDYNGTWIRAFSSSITHFEPDFAKDICVSNQSDLAIATIGLNQWRNYSIATKVVLGMMNKGGLVIRAVGHRRYYGALFNNDGTISIVRRFDDDITVLKSSPYKWAINDYVDICFTAKNETLIFTIDNKEVLRVNDSVLSHGACGFAMEQGIMTTEQVVIKKLSI